MFDDSHVTPTTRAQHDLERKLLPFHKRFSDCASIEWNQILTLKRESHIAYLYEHLEHLPKHFIVLDASRTWLVFWILHSLSLLNAPLPPKPTVEDIIFFLGQCQDSQGGFGGGPGQLPHLAATYAAVMSLAIIGTEEALQIIDRKGMEDFFLRMCVPEDRGGGMTVHENGEVDIRSCYACIAVAKLLNLDTSKIVLSCDMLNFIHQCQSFEGGLGGEPGNEAHGGYTFCGLATLSLLNEMQVLNLGSLMRWTVRMQGSMEGGFMGRTHKLVDGCYSYWQGSIFPLLTSSGLNLWTPVHAPLADQICEELESVPQYDYQIPDHFSRQEVAKKQGEFKLRKCANELGIDLNEALIQLRQISNGVESAETPLTSTSDMESFQECFENCQHTIQANEFSFCSLFPPGSASRSQLPVHEVSQVDHEVLYDALGLQYWILYHCQMNGGGLRDKPGTGSDPYHTCYCLSGLAASQQYSGLILGPLENQLQEMDPVLNILKTKRDFAFRFFNGLDSN